MLETEGAADDPVSYVGFMASRNVGVIRDEEQAFLHATKLLIAGCGSVGGCVVEPVVRMGVSSLVLPDPDVFELHNANRQSCTPADIGRSKVDVHAENARKINPYVEVTTFPEGLNPENMAAAFDGVTSVYDGIGIDSAAALWAKYLVHEYAALRRLPVMSGSDLGGKAMIYVFDYRHDPRTFYGRAKVKSFREGNELDALAMSGLRPIPTDFLQVMQARAATAAPWPQVVYCTHALGAITGRTLIDLMMGRPVKEQVGTDVHLLTRGVGHRIGQRLRWPIEARRTRALMKPPPDTWAEQERRIRERLSGLGLLGLAEAVRTTPSRYNRQPLVVVGSGPGRADVEVVADRSVHFRDRDGHDRLHTLGCASVAAEQVGDATSELTGDRAKPGLRITIEQADDAAAGLDRLQRRHTVRVPMAGSYVPGEDLRRLVAEAAGTGPRRAWVLDDVAGRGVVARTLADEVAAELSSESYATELYANLRVSRQDKDWDYDGLPIGAVDGTADRRLAPLVKSSLAAQRLATRLGWPRRLASEDTSLLTEGSALVLLSAETDGTAELYDAGRRLMTLWLDATDVGAGVHPYSLSGISPLARRRIADTFGASGQVPLVLLRLGIEPAGPQAERTSRLPLARMCRIDAPTP